MSRPALVRQHIIQVLKKEHLLSAGQLLEKLAALGQPVNKTSVYRALEALVSDGLLAQLHVEAGQLLYELAHHHHDHVICTSCGRVEAVACQLSWGSEQIPGYVVQSHQVTVYGVCEACQE